MGFSDKAFGILIAAFKCFMTSLIASESGQYFSFLKLIGNHCNE